MCIYVCALERSVPCGCSASHLNLLVSLAASLLCYVHWARNGADVVMVLVLYTGQLVIMMCIVIIKP